MGGITGWIDFTRDLACETACITAMTNSMAHRGPDQEGVWVSTRAALGNRRLVLFDKEGGRQPMLAKTDAGPVVLVFAGHIDNRQALRRELQAAGRGFESESDTEIVLNTYLEYGEGFAEHLSGAFAAAVWDGRRNILILARDRLGVQPLYYHAYPGGLLFGSEPKAIIANAIYKPKLDFTAIPILLQPRIALPGETPLAELREVPPAHILQLSRQGVALKRFWALQSRPHRESFADTAHRVRAMLEDIVKRQIDVGPDIASIGAMLSGGLDSTSISALAGKLLKQDPSGKELYTFCVRFDSDSTHFIPTELRPDIDAPYAALAAMHIGSLHKTVTAQTEDVIREIPMTRPPRDLPGWGQFDASMLLLFKEIRKHCRVAVTGEAADELFGGYPHFFDPAKIALDHFPWIEQGADKLSSYLAPDVVSVLDPREDEQARYAQLISEVPRLDEDSPEERKMREMLYVSMCGRLSVLLDRMDRMTMAVGLEMRLPFCEHELLEYVWNVPWSMKTEGGVKGLLKAAMADILPESTVNRKKSAYPHIQNPLYDETILSDAERILGDKSSPAAFMFDNAKLTTRIRQIRSGDASVNAAHMFIQLIETDQWMRDYNVLPG